jgi:glucosamine-phosphate N-acetyltransferase
MSVQSIYVPDNSATNDLPEVQDLKLSDLEEESSSQFKSHQPIEVTNGSNGETKNSEPIPLMEKLLYDPSILKGMSMTQPIGLYRPVAGSEDLLLRPLKSGDFERGYMDVIAQLSSPGEVTKSIFTDTFKRMLRCPETYYVYVIENTAENRIVGTATLFIEQKFLRGCSKRGFLEDVVVCESHRNRQLGKLLVAVAENLAKAMGLYKLTLTCKDAMIPFYCKLGYSVEAQNSTFMSIRFV